MDLRRAAAVATAVLSYIFRACALVLGALTVLLCFPSVAARMGLTNFVIDLSSALPDVIEGYGLITSPFGGVFRFDFALTMLVLFALDYLFPRISHSLR